ncbi:hypothetical protein H5410_045825, partial [Solanum commersonii]
RRNTVLHGGSYSRDKVIGDINYIVHNLIRLKFDYITVPNSWLHMVMWLNGFPHPVVCGNAILMGPLEWLIREGLQYCWENNFLNIILESNSLAMVHILNGVWEIYMGV